MNPVCTITVEGNKAVAVGTISVGEKIDVTVVGINPASVPDYGEESWFGGKSLRLRIVDTQGHDLARFPLKESDSWSVEGDRLSATDVELNTRQLRNVFSGVAYGDKLQFGLILDSGVDHAQYARGKVSIQQWAVASIDDPTVVPDWTEVLAQLDRDLAEIETSKSEAVNAAKESVEAAGASGRNALAAKESALDAASSKNDAVSAKEAAVFASSRYPRIENGRWLVWQNGAWVDNGPAQGPKGDTPSLDGVVKKDDVVPVEIPDGDTIAVIGGKEIKSPKGGGGTPADYSTVRTNAAKGAAHAADSSVHVTSAEKTKWNAKQDALSDAQLANIGDVPNKLAKTDVIDPATATTAGKAADAKKVAEALAGKLNAKGNATNSIYWDSNGNLHILINDTGGADDAIIGISQDSGWEVYFSGTSRYARRLITNAGDGEHEVIFKDGETRLRNNDNEKWYAYLDDVAAATKLTPVKDSSGATVGYKLGAKTAETDPTLNGMTADDITRVAEAAVDDKLPIALEAKTASFAAEDGKRYTVAAMPATLAVTLPSYTGDAAKVAHIFEARFDGSALTADASVTFVGGTATTMDTDCGTVKAGKIALMSAFWNGATWDVSWKNQG